MRLGVVAHRGYEQLPDILRTLFDIAPSLGITLFFEEELFDEAGGGTLLRSPHEIDVAVSLGGDGTLLRTARFLAGAAVPILGVNLGRLGFLTSCGSDGFEQAVRDLVAGRYDAEARMALHARAVNASGVPYEEWRALNDFVMHKGGFARMLSVGVRVNGEQLGTYAVDGIVISSPTGSTAYSLSAGGPLIFPTLESIIVTPISAHALTARPIVLPPDAEVTLEAVSGPDEVLVTADGQVGTKFGQGDKLVVCRAERPVLIVRFPGASFFERLRVKLGWGGLPLRDEPKPC